ncbi:MAG: hypothetical protein HGA98_04630, partial [Deltaproteobacteria bacterium]|nr:hypothetical protein [Deltaproteobacteria bacterium]
MGDRTGRGRSTVRTALLAALLVAAGVAANYLRYPIFFSIEFLFGSIFSLLALQLLGLGPGVVVAAAVSSSTYLLWNHPYAVVIMTCEVLVVGLLVRRREMELVLADALYWLFLGMPLVYLFYHGVMKLPPENAGITMMKQALNGVTNALAARLVFLAAASRVRRRAFSLREVVFNLLALFSLGPSLFLLAAQSRSELTDSDHSVREALRAASDRVKTNLDQWLHDQLEDVARIAASVPAHTLPELQRSLQETMGMGKAFLRMGLLDRTATTIAYWPLTDELGHSNLGKSFADRPFLPALKTTLRPMLSEVVVGRIGVPRPIVTALAPVVARGAYDGYVSATLSLDGLAAIVARNAHSHSLPGVVFSLVDRNGNAIVTTRPGAKRMSPLVWADGERENLGDGVWRWVPRSRKNVSISERWKRSVYVAETGVGPGSEWRLVLEQPIAPFQARLYGAYMGKIGFVLAVLAATFPLAALLSRRVSLSLSRLEATTANLPERVESGQAVAWPEANVRETRQLVENFRTVADALTQKFGEMKGLNASLEARVDERTRELRESEEKYRSLAGEQEAILNGAPVGISLVAHRKIVWANPAHGTLLGYPPEQIAERGTRALYASEDDFRRVGSEGYETLRRG